MVGQFIKFAEGAMDVVGKGQFAEIFLESQSNLCKAVSDAKLTGQKQFPSDFHFLQAWTFQFFVRVIKMCMH